MADLTVFQIKCEAELNACLAKVGARLFDRQIVGQREAYITAKIHGTELQVYIYSDEAQVQGAGVDERFETPDFKSADQLCDAFVLKAVELAKNAVA